MAIEEIIRLFPPPAEPVQTGSVGEWSEIERAVGTELPPDLFELAARYGSGQFAGLIVYNPFSPRYRQVVQDMLHIYRGLHEDLGRSAVPFPLFPNQPGLFPAGKEVNGGTLFWLTEGDPKAWPLILTDTTFSYQRFDMPITTFLYRLFSKDIDCLWWNRSELDEYYPQVVFRPFSPQEHPRKGPVQ